MDSRWPRRIFIVVCATLLCGIVANVLIWILLNGQAPDDRLTSIEARVTELERTAITR